MIYSGAFFVKYFYLFLSGTKKSKYIYKNKQNKMDNLEKYHGKTMFLVTTELKDGKLKQIITEKKVYDPKDKNRRVRPAAGTDLVISGASWSKDHIYYEKKGLSNTLGHWDLKTYNRKILMTFVFPGDVEMIKALHIDKIKESVCSYLIEIEKIKEIYGNLKF